VSTIAPVKVIILKNSWFFMNAKNIAVAGIAGGTLLLLLLVAINMIVNLVIPYDIMKFGGMRAADDPVLILFFLYPFVIWVFPGDCI